MKLKKACRVFVGLSLVASVGGCFDPEDAPAEGSTGEPASTGEPSTGEPTMGETSTGDDTPKCADYCSLIEDHCEDDLKQYPGDAACEAMCAAMNPGTAEDELGNTVGCRIHHTLLAGEMPEPHCHHAGPAGENTCGAGCESFCTVALGVCTEGNAVWPDAEACIADCIQFPEEPPYTANVPDGDSFECRMHHLSLASLQPDVHCEHIGLVSAVCQ